MLRKSHNQVYEKPKLILTFAEKSMIDILV